MLPLSNVWMSWQQIENMPHLAPLVRSQFILLNDEHDKNLLATKVSSEDRIPMLPACMKKSTEIVLEKSICLSYCIFFAMLICDLEMYKFSLSIMSLTQGNKTET